MRLDATNTGDLICPKCDHNLTVKKTDERGEIVSGIARCGACKAQLRVSSYIVFKAEAC